MMTILHPTDFSESAVHAEEQAGQLARSLGGEVVLLHVSVERPGRIRAGEARGIWATQRAWAKEGLRTHAAVLRNRDVPVRWRLRSGTPSDEIIKAAEEERADLIVMGTNGRHGLPRLLFGSVAETVVRRARCPVLTVRRANEPIE
jgi:nucleotide-binding universal stress UspA family protein